MPPGFDTARLDGAGHPFSRRRLLLGAAATAAAATAVATTGIASGPGIASAAGSPAARLTANLTQIPATENLMREHGVLKRVLLVYGEAGRRIAARQAVPADALAEAASVIHNYIEGFHEALEEGYVFPRLRRARQLVSTVDVLLTQHARGRLLTQAILTSATRAGLASPSISAAIAHNMALFVRMYEPHEAREDTVVFPAYRALLSDRELEQVAQLFSSDQTDQFGPKGFADVVARVAAIEGRFGIAELDQFTPPAP